jgi:uncharacterized protein YecA (UPF0149 family)
MPSLDERPELVGFFSYSRDDDSDSFGALSRLRDRIQRELRGQLGRSPRDFRIWQDKEAIAPGKLWEATIRDAVAKSVFFIPIITPTSVRSKFCRFEFDEFLAREHALGRDDLIFPILYVRVPAMEVSTRWQDDPVLTMIAQRQYVDWRKFRHLDITSTDVSEAIEHLCRGIVDALERPGFSEAEVEQHRREEAEELHRNEEEHQRQELERLAREAARQTNEQQKSERAAQSAARQREAEETARLADQKRKVEEAARQAQQKREAAETARLAEQKRKADETARLSAEKHGAEEAPSTAPPPRSLSSSALPPAPGDPSMEEILARWRRILSEEYTPSNLADPGSTADAHSHATVTPGETNEQDLTPERDRVGGWAVPGDRKTHLEPNDPRTWGSVGRNAACPCGSGKKYKYCHGRLHDAPAPGSTREAGPSAGASRTKIDGAPKDVVARARGMLATGNASGAAELLAGAPDGPGIANARAVCALRLGYPPQAVQLLRPVVLPNEARSPPEKTPDNWIINYATALALTGDPGGAGRALGWVKDASYPGAAQLRGALDAWHASLSWTEATRHRLIGELPRPIRLDFPPGAF